MTADIVRAPCLSAFDAELPAIDYEHAQGPDEAHRRIRQAQQQGPIAMGPHGPEVLTHELVRSILRDDRFVVPQGLSLAAQGVTSGHLWDKVSTLLLSLDGAEHHRLRRLVSKAFTPKAADRLRTTCVDVITELVGRTPAPVIATW
jgi:cytochrome P450